MMLEIAMNQINVTNLEEAILNISNQDHHSFE